MPNHAQPGRDYVLVARSAVLTCPFQDLEKDLLAALSELARRHVAVKPGATRATSDSSHGDGRGASTAC